MALSALELYKKLPKTNCRECGQATCLAFATQVVVEGEDVNRCPYLPEEVQALQADIAAQQDQGVGRRREMPVIALAHLQEKVSGLDFAVLAPGLGARYQEEGGRGYLALAYFGLEMRVFKDEVRYPDGAAANPWDAILLYNYIASQGDQEPAGPWITYDSLPNSISKTKTLNRLAAKLAAEFSGRREELARRGAAQGGRPAEVAPDAEVQLIFRPLPRVPVVLLFWDQEREENFPASARFLFDAGVMTYLDLESLLFLVERLLERLHEAA
jgi:hypothetical protein